MQGYDDAKLVQIAMRGTARGRSAYDVLVQRHKDWLYSYLLHLLRDPGLADDAAQETFLRGWLALRNLAKPEAFRGWLRTIATRTAFNVRRAAGTRIKYEEAGQPAPVHIDTHELVATDELVDQVLAGLPFSYREVMVLRYVEDLSLLELAEVLGLGTSAAKMRLKRARDAFQALYEELGDNGT